MAGPTCLTHPFSPFQSQTEQGAHKSHTRYERALRRVKTLVKNESLVAGPRAPHFLTPESVFAGEDAEVLASRYTRALDRSNITIHTPWIASSPHLTQLVVLHAVVHPSNAAYDGTPTSGVARLVFLARSSSALAKNCRRTKSPQSRQAWYTNSLGQYRTMMDRWGSGRCLSDMRSTRACERTFSAW